MARYHFDIHDTKLSSIDADGQDCADREAVTCAALRLLCTIARDDPLQHLHGQLGTVVRDEGGRVVLTATVSLNTLWVGDA